MNPDQTFSTTIGGHEMTLSTGKLAGQAGGAVSIRQGDTMLLTTATMSKNMREGMSFFPLTVDFEEKIYAAGRIPGSFFRREARASTEGILTARVTDRAIRPLFPKGMRNEVQVITTAISSDSVHHLDLLSLNAASAALHISDVPWAGPVAAVRVGYIDGQLVVNATIQEMEASALDLRVAGSRDAILMVEAGAEMVSEALMVEALLFAHQQMQPLLDLFEEMRAAVGKEKREVALQVPDPALVAEVTARLDGRMKAIVAEKTERSDRNEAMAELREAIIGEYQEADPEANSPAGYEVFEGLLKKAMRNRILYDGIRPDGRAYNKVRDLSSETNISPRAHGSGLFQRGETQVLSVATLGTPRDAQKVDGLYPLDSRRFMHHYNFPPYSTGETWFLRGPKRREIGHGMLGLTALTPVIPDEESFPYTIRVVSEVLSSNGSTSQAAICAAALALMDCGVPLKDVVGGVAMGLVSDGTKYAILSDIQGLEDHIGDMDFKVAGTEEGITALQMDIKLTGISPEMMAEALEQARQARLEIIASMKQTLPAPREQLSEWAPRMESIKIDSEQIGAVIGKGGSTVRALQDEYDVAIDIQEDGTIFVAGVDGIRTTAAIERIKQIAKGPEIGDTILGKVVRITDFGAFVELLPGTDGLVHISQMSPERIDRVEDVVDLGDELLVMITDKDRDGKYRLSRKAVIAGMSLEEARDADPAIRGGGRGGRDGGRGGRDGGWGGRGGNDRRRRRD